MTHAYVIPIHYHIKLIHLIGIYDSYLAELLNLEDEYDSFNFHRESRTTINILRLTQYIKLHISMIIIPQKITMIKNHGKIYALKNFIQNSETNLFEFHFSNELSSGFYTLKLVFFNQLTESSSKNFFKSFYTNKKSSVV